jgi:hypothetical protein
MSANATESRRLIGSGTNGNGQLSSGLQPHTLWVAGRYGIPWGTGHNWWLSMGVGWISIDVVSLIEERHGSWIKSHFEAMDS